MTPGDVLPRYEPADDLWVVSCHYNHERYATVTRNARTFVEVLAASRMNWLVVECAFGAAPFEFAPSRHVAHVRARDLMWQKERLLNLAIRRLPPECRKVAWLDCDVLFEDPAWAVQTSELLDAYAIVQPFAQSVRLPRGATRDVGGYVSDSFGAVYHRAPALSPLANYERHGHTGFGWAARRDLLERHGLYDACIAGGGDHLMAHALCGHFDSPCVAMIAGPLGAVRHEHFLRWARPFARDVAGRIAAARGRALHLWHGDVVNRSYVQRHRELARLGFDPAVDLRVGPDGCWEWGRDHPDLHHWMREYFRNRREDDAVADGR